ncbi:MAG: cupredoxin domain-containing protein [Bacteroidota bacterium]
MKTLILVSVVCLSTLFTDCSKKPTGTREANEIWLEYKLFVPQQLVVKAGTTVKFTNKDNANHSATNLNGLFDSGKITSDNSYSYTFDKVGTYSFYCNYHSSNTSEQGYIIVQ